MPDNSPAAVASRRRTGCRCGTSSASRTIRWSSQVSCRRPGEPAHHVDAVLGERGHDAPMPDSISSCGLLIAPPHSTTSRRACTTRRWRQLLEFHSGGTCSVEHHPRGDGLRCTASGSAAQRGLEIRVGGAPPRSPALVTRVSQSPSVRRCIPATAVQPSCRSNYAGLRWREMTSGPFSMRLKYSSTLA